MATHQYIGFCSCKLTTFRIELPSVLSAYHPRACDCDFCTQRRIAYLSDPAGTGSIGSVAPLSEQQQGSEQAKFLTCSSCGDVIAATCTFNGQLKGAINATLLEKREALGTSETASPKLLPPQEKKLRWEHLWMNLTLTNLNINQ